MVNLVILEKVLINSLLIGSKKIREAIQKNVKQRGITAFHLADLKNILLVKIFRILAFEFRQADTVGIKISLISDMVSSLFYPNDVAGDSKSAFKDLIEKAFKTYTRNNKEEITEDQFCQAMESIDRYINQETNDRFLQKIFRRHSKADKNYLNKDEFRFLMSNYKDENITEKDIQEIYDRMACGDKNGISYENFKKFSL